MNMQTQEMTAMAEKITDYSKCHESLGQVIPTVEGLAKYLGIRPQAIDDWSQPELVEAVAMMMDKQHILLLKKGLTGEIDPEVAKLLLIANHGYSDKVDVSQRALHTLKIYQSDRSAV